MKLRFITMLLFIIFFTHTAAGAVYSYAPDNSIYSKTTITYTDPDEKPELDAEDAEITDDAIEDNAGDAADDSEKAVKEPAEPVEVTSVKLDKQTLDIKTNETVALSVKCLPSNAEDTSVIWFSSNSEVAEVSSEGEVTGITEGVTIITAMSNAIPWIFDTCEVRVEKDYLSTIALGRKAVKLSVGSVMPIAVITAPSTAYDQSYTWTCDNEDIAEMLPDNVIRALKPGAATFTVTANEYKEDGRPAENKVFVTVISTADYYCTVGKTISFKAAITVEDTDSLIWNVYRLTTDSLEKAGAGEVDLLTNKLNCKFFGHTVGEYRIEITDPDNEKNVQIIHINVKEPVKRVVAYLEGDETKKKRRVELTVNRDGTDPQKIKLYAAIEPENATYKDVYWKSSKPDVAAIDENGIITPLTVGSSVITCVSATDNKKSTFTVTVKLNPKSIKLDKTEPITLRVGASSRLRATVDKFKNSSGAIIWNSSNPDAVTVKDGKITAVGIGKAVITASTLSGNVSASVEVISVILPSKIFASSKKLEMTVGEEAVIDVRFDPQNVSETALVYESRNTGVAAVDGNGNITAVGAGTTTVTVTAINGKKVSVLVVVR